MNYSTNPQNKTYYTDYPAHAQTGQTRDGDPRDGGRYVASARPLFTDPNPRAAIHPDLRVFSSADDAIRAYRADRHSDTSSHHSAVTVIDDPAIASLPMSLPHSAYVQGTDFEKTLSNLPPHHPVYNFAPKPTIDQTSIIDAAFSQIRPVRPTNCVISTSQHAPHDPKHCIIVPMKRAMLSGDSKSLSDHLTVFVTRLFVSFRSTRFALLTALDMNDAVKVAKTILSRLCFHDLDEITTQLLCECMMNALVEALTTVAASKNFERLSRDVIDIVQLCCDDRNAKSFPAATPRIPHRMKIKSLKTNYADIPQSRSVYTTLSPPGHSSHAVLCLYKAAEIAGPMYSDRDRYEEGRPSYHTPGFFPITLPSLCYQTFPPVWTNETWVQNARVEMSYDQSFKSCVGCKNAFLRVTPFDSDANIHVLVFRSFCAVSSDSPASSTQWWGHNYSNAPLLPKTLYSSFASVDAPDAQWLDAVLISHSLVRAAEPRTHDICFRDLPLNRYEIEDGTGNSAIMSDDLIVYAFSADNNYRPVTFTMSNYPIDPATAPLPAQVTMSGTLDPVTPVQIVSVDPSVNMNVVTNSALAVTLSGTNSVELSRIHDDAQQNMPLWTTLERPVYAASVSAASTPNDVVRNTARTSPTRCSFITASSIDTQAYSLGQWNAFVACLQRLASGRLVPFEIPHDWVIPKDDGSWLDGWIATHEVILSAQRNHRDMAKAAWNRMMHAYNGNIRMTWPFASLAIEVWDCSVIQESDRGFYAATQSMLESASPDDQFIAMCLSRSVVTSPIESSFSIPDDSTAAHSQKGRVRASDVSPPRTRVRFSGAAVSSVLSSESMFDDDTAVALPPPPPARHRSPASKKHSDDRVTAWYKKTASELTSLDSLRDFLLEHAAVSDRHIMKVMAHVPQHGTVGELVAAYCKRSGWQVIARIFANARHTAVEIPTPISDFEQACIDMCTRSDLEVAADIVSPYDPYNPDNPVVDDTTKVRACVVLAWNKLMHAQNGNIAWSISNKTRNKLAHALNGNTTTSDYFQTLVGDDALPSLSVATLQESPKPYIDDGEVTALLSLTPTLNAHDSLNLFIARSWIYIANAGAPTRNAVQCVKTFHPFVPSDAVGGAPLPNPVRYHADMRHAETVFIERPEWSAQRMLISSEVASATNRNLTSFTPAGEAVWPIMDMLKMSMPASDWDVVVYKLLVYLKYYAMSAPSQTRLMTPSLYNAAASVGITRSYLLNGVPAGAVVIGGDGIWDGAVANTITVHAGGANVFPPNANHDYDLRRVNFVTNVANVPQDHVSNIVMLPRSLLNHFMPDEVNAAVSMLISLWADFPCVPLNVRSTVNGAHINSVFHPNTVLIPEAGDLWVVVPVANNYSPYMPLGNAAQMRARAMWGPTFGQSAVAYEGAGGAGVIVTVANAAIDFVHDVGLGGASLMAYLHSYAWQWTEMMWTKFAMWFDSAAEMPPGIVSRINTMIDLHYLTLTMSPSNALLNDAARPAGLVHFNGGAPAWQPIAALPGALPVLYQFPFSHPVAHTSQLAGLTQLATPGTTGQFRDAGLFTPLDQYCTLRAYQKWIRMFATYDKFYGMVSLPAPTYNPTNDINGYCQPVQALMHAYYDYRAGEFDIYGILAAICNALYGHSFESKQTGKTVLCNSLVNNFIVPNPAPHVPRLLNRRNVFSSYGLRIHVMSGEPWFPMAEPSKAMRVQHVRAMLEGANVVAFPKNNTTWAYTELSDIFIDERYLQFLAWIANDIGFAGANALEVVDSAAALAPQYISSVAQLWDNPMLNPFADAVQNEYLLNGDRMRRAPWGLALRTTVGNEYRVRPVAATLNLYLNVLRGALLWSPGHWMTPSSYTMPQSIMSVIGNASTSTMITKFSRNRTRQTADDLKEQSNTASQAEVGNSETSKE